MWQAASQRLQEVQRLLQQQPAGQASRRVRSRTHRTLLRTQAHELSSALQDQALIHSAAVMLDGPGASRASSRRQRQQSLQGFRVWGPASEAGPGPAPPTHAHAQHATLDVMDGTVEHGTIEHDTAEHGTAEGTEQLLSDLDCVAGREEGGRAGRQLGSGRGREDDALVNTKAGGRWL